VPVRPAALPVTERRAAGAEAGPSLTVDKALLADSVLHRRLVSVNVTRSPPSTFRRC
jgi:hypothetical protein